MARPYSKLDTLGVGAGHARDVNPELLHLLGCHISTDKGEISGRCEISPRYARRHTGSRHDLGAPEEMAQTIKVDQRALHLIFLSSLECGAAL